MDIGDFRFVVPGEQRVAAWAAGRVRKVQGDTRQLVAGAFVILAAMWGSLCTIAVLVGIVLEVATTTGGVALALLVVAFGFGGMSAVRLRQSRNARKQERP